jgi:hypothetical protein
VIVDTDEIDPVHLRELADLLMEEQRRIAERRTARLAEMWDRPALGAYLKRDVT